MRLLPKRFCKFVLLPALLLGLLSSAWAAYANWKEIAAEMQQILNGSYETYVAGDEKKARDQVNVAYYQFYEKWGFERSTMTYISGNRASQVEYQFSEIRKAMLKKADKAQVRAALDQLNTMLMEDAKALDGDGEEEGSDPFWRDFIASLLIILREGFEAILIVGAILAYLVKSGNADKQKPVIHGSLLAVAASFVMAWILNSMAGDSGQNQEITEGLTMLVAVVVLFYVSNFMIAKADAAAWTGYIKGKVSSSLATGSMFALAFTAFLAVFREGAEVILFYQALLSGSGSSAPVWWGFGVGCVLLVFVYLAIRHLSIRLPLKVFFVGTSLLMYVMCVAFTGAAVKEFQEGEVIGVTQVPYVPTVDLLGLYPTVETLLPQLAVAALCLITIVLAVRNWKRERAKLAAAQQKN
ncbi:MAG: FTR1 family iron permease [Succinivibrio sp.]|nr:FTR1 family iron permease [Succinivibrio sp.]